MIFCLPVGAPRIYGVAIRHDRNGNGKTEIMKDGGGMSNNPSKSIWNLGKPSFKKVGVEVQRVSPWSIRMRVCIPLRSRNREEYPSRCGYLQDQLLLPMAAASRVKNSGHRRDRLLVTAPLFLVILIATVPLLL